MDSSSSFSNCLPQHFVDSFQDLINIYNNQKISSEIKKQSLEKIKAIAAKFLKETILSQQAQQEIKSLIKQVKVRYEDIDLWNQKMGEISSDTIDFTELSQQGPLQELGEDPYLLIVENLEKIEEIDALALTNHRFHTQLNTPSLLTHFLDKFSSNLSLEKRFKLALRCQTALTELDLSHIQLDNKKLKTLKKTCFNLQSLDLSHIPLRSLKLSPFPPIFHPFLQFLNPPCLSRQLNLSILHSFTKLEKISLEKTEITSLEMLSENLKELNLNCCQNLSAEEFQFLHYFLSLEKLSLIATRIATLEMLCENLKELNLSCCKGLIAKEFERLGSFIKLEKLYIVKTEIATLGMLPKSLKELNLNSCQNLTAEEFQKLDDSFSTLEMLIVSCTKITALDTLPKSLKRLDLSNCKNLTAKEFQNLNSFSKLEQLYVENTEIKMLDQLPKSLKELDLSNCNNLTVQEIEKLASFDQLQVIDLPTLFQGEEIISILKDLNKQIRFR